MKIRLVSYEKTHSWILSKITACLADELRLQGVTVEVGDSPDPLADINHHVIYSQWNGRPSSADTLMITHIDTAGKTEQIKEQLKTADMGICVSSDTLHKLAALGVPRERLGFINYPSPQQGKIQPRKISVGITSRCHAYGSKREYLLAQLAPRLEPGAFVFHIMGPGWDAVIEELRRFGSEVVGHGDFDPERYRGLWPQLDYYLYLGQDEGSTGFLDAMEAGIPTIVTPQGFHLDLPAGLTHAFNDLEGLAQIFSEITEARSRRKLAVAALSWPEYARKHLIVWHEVLNRRAGRILYPVSPEELTSVGMGGEALAAASTDNPWMGRMPAKAGPGGGAHRPRLLVVADEPLDRPEEAWRQIIHSAPQDRPMYLNRAGSPSGNRSYPSQSGLEIVMLDYRSCSDEEIVRLSFDFDAVGFWNIAPLRLLKQLQRRSKTNYTLPYEWLWRNNERLPGQSVPARLGRKLFFGFVHNSRKRSRAITASFWTRSLQNVCAIPDSRGPLREFLSGVDAVFHTEPDWEPELKLGARSYGRVPRPESGASWEPALNMLFRIIQNNPAKESGTLGSFAASLFSFVVRHWPWTKPSPS